MNCQIHYYTKIMYNCLTCQSTDFECTWWRLLQKRVDVYWTRYFYVFTIKGILYTPMLHISNRHFRWACFYYNRNIIYTYAPYFKQSFSMSMFLRQRWTDLRLKYEAPDGLTKIELDRGIRHEIWVPDLSFMSDTNAYFHDVTVPNRMMFLYPSGYVSYSTR